MNVLITGAAGNLGSLLSAYLLKNTGLKLILLQHKTQVSEELASNRNAEVRTSDLEDINSLRKALCGADVIVHFAGVLFRARPEKFLPKTNFEYFKNLVNSAIESNVKRIILISFPHVEGPTGFEYPAKGKLDGNPVSVHAQTRLLEEKYLFSNFKNGVSLRAGMVYGKGILMIEGARWFAKHRMLGVWNEPTQIHLISKIDFCRAAEAAIVNDNINGIYHIGDNDRITLQEFLDTSCTYWGYKKPKRISPGFIYATSKLFEFVSFVFRVRSPLTKDFIDIGRVSYYGDTSRMKKELIPDLIYPTLKDGINTM